MRRRARRGGMLPLASAMLLSLAAGLSLAEEHIGPLVAGSAEPVVTANSLGKGEVGVKPAPQGKANASSRQKSTEAGERGTDTTGAGDGGRSNAGAKAGQGVGSRALKGREAEDRAADQPVMATGVDLQGPPVRFPAADTPE